MPIPALPLFKHRDTVVTPADQKSIRYSIWNYNGYNVEWCYSCVKSAITRY